ncbi:FYVE, RhoGEF and PH domain-containing protein 2 [Echinops telfairi]|uniref:FYVE, RhoGEF and PH domain-containing protein 2 n=1 Tax=Echinops telfairi TaxID=9371 RepID=A0AC55DG48_ECHTE|nr:FYVE, RhoGEF and PH domain-containing protein 2 [Echinops telfairi]
MEGENVKGTSVSNLVTALENSRYEGTGSHRGPFRPAFLGGLQGRGPRNQPDYLRYNCRTLGKEPEKRIVQELLETEQAYVARLYLLDQASTRTLGPQSPGTASPRIGDVIQKLAPFLKMYSEYVKNFDRAADLLATWTDKSPPFQEVISRIQSSEASGSLTLQHHMLEPVQRIPRYELLLKEYLQKLPAQAPDRDDAQKALDMIFSAAQHSNAAIKEMERLQDLWDVYQRLGLEDDIVDPSNTLLREGPVLKISFRRSDPIERYLFLELLQEAWSSKAFPEDVVRLIFSNISSIHQLHSQFFLPALQRRLDNWPAGHTLNGKALRCLFSYRRRSVPTRRLPPDEQGWQSITGPLGQTCSCPLRRSPPPEAGAVRELSDTEFPHAFLVSGKQRTLELQARSQEEMISWMQACQAAIDQTEKRNESFKAAVQGSEGDARELELQSEELGLRAPQWVRDKMVTMCMRCQEPFNALRRRRHHCRACGYVVCARCSEYRAELKYDDNRPNRVCCDCYVFLTGNILPKDKEDKRRGILEKASEQGLMCGFLQLLGGKWDRSGPRAWAVIPWDDPLVLYIYAAPQDTRAHTSIPLLGYQVTAGPQMDPRVFQLQQSGQLYTFKAETKELRDRWAQAVERAARGQSPDGTEGDLSD